MDDSRNTQPTTGASGDTIITTDLDNVSFASVSSRQSDVGDKTSITKTTNDDSAHQDGKEGQNQSTSSEQIKTQSNDSSHTANGHIGSEVPVANGTIAHALNGHAKSTSEYPQNGNHKPIRSEEDVVIRDPNTMKDNEDERDDIQPGKKKKRKMVGFFQLFRYANSLDIMIMLVGIIASCATGLAFPMNLLVYGDVITQFVNDGIQNNLLAANGSNTTESDIFGTVSGSSWYFVMIAVIVTITGFLQMLLWYWTASHQVKVMRMHFFKSVMRQDMAWHDQHASGAIASSLASDLVSVEAGIGEKLALLVQWFSAFVGGYMVAFIKSWQLTLVSLSLAPLIIIAAGASGKIVGGLTQKELKSYASAGGVAEEAFRAVRTVVAFSGQDKEVHRFQRELQKSKRFGIVKGLLQGVANCLVWMLLFGMMALAFWYGGKLVRDESLEPGNVLQVIFGVLVGSMSLGHAMPSLEALTEARGAAHAIFETIDRPSEIDTASADGDQPEKCEGNIELEDVHFSYPSRPDVPVMKGVSFRVSVGKTVAVVGPSGSGKSTVVQLLQRFYDPIKGKVKIDGNDLRGLNVHWLRQQIGVVSQEPVLFSASIAENIQYGREGITQADIEIAAKEANAHNFIIKLPEGYSTQVGGFGSQLSGGQKQRIAIARALVRNPKILLLDEATSALDNESEALVQSALEKASKGRTTIIVAHRLSTVRNSDLIIGIQNGCVLEVGTHDQLMEKEGLYYDLATNQMQRGSDKYDEISIQSAEDVSNFKNEAFSRKRSLGSGGSLRRLRTTSGTDQSQADESEDVSDAAASFSLSRVMKLNAPEGPQIIIGCIAAIFTGAVYPAFATLFSEILGVFAMIDKEEQARQISFLAGMIFLVGVLSGIGSIIMYYCFAYSGENLTNRLRIMAFRAILRQEIGWFDDPKNSVGSLTARLSSDAASVKGATGTALSMVVQALSNLGTAVLIAFIVGPILTCVAILFLPLMVLSGILQSKVVAGIDQGSNLANDAGKIASEAFDNIRTVAALTREETFEEKYEVVAQKINMKSRKKALVFGLTYGFAQSMQFFSYAAILPFGSWLVMKGMMEFKNVFRVFGCIIFGGQGLGRAAAFAPGYSKAKTSASALFTLFDRQPPIDSASTEGHTLDTIQGKIELKNVSFEYPQRTNVKVLQNFNLSVEPGRKMALVGMSGCGKSTTVQLMERFYDPVKGQVKLDGHDLASLNVQWLRAQIGIVSQEPILFDLSIRENIEYGDNSREVDMSEVIEAAKKANIHQFITSLPQGYETNVGEKGAQLSGGQKQRIAIARALIRNPKILLLDEATSALDMESEKVVQKALDVAQEGRTCLIIAHRLATVQNADTICVIKSGQVVEEGTHKELMREGGVYSNLVNVNS